MASDPCEQILLFKKGRLYSNRFIARPLKIEIETNPTFRAALS